MQVVVKGLRAEPAEIIHNLRKLNIDWLIDWIQVKECRKDTGS